MFRPGGGVEKGARAQEEHLFRCTSAYRTHRSEWYPLGQTGVIYSPEVRVFMGRRADHAYELQRVKPYTVSMLAVSAPRKPRLRDRVEYRYEDDLDQMRLKIDSIFSIARKHGHRTLVLGALGCGAYGNPAQQVAQLFSDAIQTHGAHFDTIAFAVLPGGKHADNYEIFKSVLE